MLAYPAVRRPAQAMQRWTMQRCDTARRLQGQEAAMELLRLIQMLIPWVS